MRAGAPVAQGIERPPPKRKVPSSNLGRGTTKTRGCGPVATGLCRLGTNFPQPRRRWLATIFQPPVEAYARVMMKSFLRWYGPRSAALYAVGLRVVGLVMAGMSACAVVISVLVLNGLIQDASPYIQQPQVDQVVADSNSILGAAVFGVAALMGLLLYWLGRRLERAVEKYDTELRLQGPED